VASDDRLSEVEIDLLTECVSWRICQHKEAMRMYLGAEHRSHKSRKEHLERLLDKLKEMK
jgi:hypothetical protein